MHDYLEAVAAGRLPVNRDIIALMQDIFNLLPNLNMTRLSEALTGASSEPWLALSPAAPVAGSSAEETQDECCP